MPRHNRIRILFAVALLAGTLRSVATRAEPPVIPPADGAPGENEPPQFAEEQAGPAGPNLLQAPPGLQLIEDVVQPDGEDDKSKLDDLDKRAPVRKGRQTAWDKAESAAKAGQWDDALNFLEQWHDRGAKDDWEDYS